VERTVAVWGKAQTVGVYQKLKAVWIAIGDYMGKLIESKGSSAASALSHWRAAAQYIGNG
jgi:hypothetical protein